MHRFDVKTIKTIKTTQNYKCDQITMNLHRFDVNTIKNVEYVAKHSKQRKTTKVIKLWQFASIWRQNDQKSWVTSQNIPNNAKLRKWSKYNYLHRLDVEKIKNVALSRKTFKTTQNYKSDHITMNLHRFDVKTIKNVELRRKTFKTTLNYKSNQITITCINFKSKTSKQRKTTNTIKLRRFASIWRQNDLNNAKLQKRWNYDNLHRFDVKTIKNVEIFAKHSIQRKTTKATKLQWIASIGRRNNKKCWVTSQNIQTNAKLQNWSNYNYLHQF